MSETQALEREEVGRKRRSIRVLSGIGSQADLAEKAGLSRPTVSAAEAGGQLSESTLRALVEALGCTADEYLG